MDLWIVRPSRVVVRLIEGLLLPLACDDRSLVLGLALRGGLGLALVLALRLPLAVFALAALAGLGHVDRAATQLSVVELLSLLKALLGLEGDESDALALALVVQGRPQRLDLAASREGLAKRLLLGLEGQASHKCGELIVAFSFALALLPLAAAL